MNSELTARGFDVWSMDWRGQGASGRALENPQKGHIDRFETYLADLTWFVDTIIGARDGEGETLLMAHSMGGHITLRAVLEGRIKPDRFILSAPMIDLPMQGISRYAITALCSAMAGIDLGSRYVAGTGDYDPARVKFDGNPLTGDRKRFDAIHAAIAANPVVAMGGPTFGWLNATFRSVRVLRNLAQQSPRTCPILLFTAMSDTVVSVTPPCRTANRFRSRMRDTKSCMRPTRSADSSGRRSTGLHPPASRCGLLPAGPCCRRGSATTVSHRRWPRPDPARWGDEPRREFYPAF